ncbi:MAG: homocysteine S-methyltransferase family protein [Thomasclavelia sp.]|nr:homocysteine S-methyltransferase family protein [Thomasclavelia sp.]
MLLDRLNKDILVFDGAMGTMLQQAGLKMGETPENLNIEKPELLIDIHKSYLDNGSDFISTNTFGANPLKLDSKYSSKEVIEAALNNALIAKKSSDHECYIAYDMGPVGKLMEPMGTLTFDEVYDSVKYQVEIAKDKVDVFILETMSDIYEVKAAVLAIKENCDKPVFVSMTFESNKRTLSGCDPISMVNILEGLKVDALGINCSLGPKEITPIINDILAYSHTPVIMQPNAGLPVMVDGKTCYKMDKETFVKESLVHVNNGVCIVGGCCGTTPEFIRLLKDSLPSKVKTLNNPKKTIVSSGVKSAIFSNRVLVCGERLNPTGKKKMKEALKSGKYDYVVSEGIRQMDANADVLDVNVGVPGTNETVVMKEVIKKLQEVIDLPLQIDSSYPEAIEIASRYYNGKPLINSVNGKKEVMDAIFPIVKKYGGVVIGLTLDESGIPTKAIDRYNVAKKIIEYAKSYGIDKSDIIIDCLVLTASAQQKEVMETIKAVKMVKELGVHTALGVSNVSFGLPNRPLLNKTFLTMALSYGLDLPIINPLDKELMDMIDAFNVLNNNDLESKVYIDHQSNNQIEKKDDQKEFDLVYIIKKGLKDEVKKTTIKELEKVDGLTLVNKTLIPALNEVGKEYEKGIIFLPQLIQAAETSKIAFECVKDTFKNTKASKGPIILATVEGDIHDIGKNIVKVVLESYGYEVIDLGRDVSKEIILEAYHKYHPKAIGLSALMTTTVISMKDTITLLKKQANMCPICVGGAVLTQEYADEIQADFYGEDAMATVEYLNKIIKD